MKRTILLLAILFLIASSLQAAPLTWHITGTTTDGTYNGSPVQKGLPFELRIFLNTDVPGQTFPPLPEVYFPGPFQAEAEIANLGVLPLAPYTQVAYFVTGGLVTEALFFQGFFNTFRL